MEQAGKLIAFAGAALLIADLAVWLLGKSGFRGLPGDIRIERENFRFYFPVVTCLVISAILTLVAWLWHWLRRG